MLVAYLCRFGRVQPSESLAMKRTDAMDLARAISRWVGIDSPFVGG